MINRHNQIGIGLVEVMVALSIFALGLLPLLQVQSQLQQLTSHAYQRYAVALQVSRKLSVLLATTAVEPGIEELTMEGMAVTLKWHTETTSNLNTVYINGIWQDALGRQQQLSMMSSKARSLAP